jgi:phage tail sheath gpL-like
MDVAFNNMPGDIRVPFIYAEFNAGTPPYSGTSRTVLIGRMLNTGSAAVGTPVNIGAGDPNALFGAGSMLADMAVWARYHNPVGEIWALPAANPGGAVAATKTITITGPATAGGTLVLYICGERYEIGVANGDSATAVAAAVVTAVGKGFTKFTRRMSAPVTAANVSGVVTLTARHAGAEGELIRVEMGLDGNEITPTGLTVTIASGTTGSGDVDMAATLANLGSMEFDWIVAPYVTTGQLDAVRDYLGNSGSGRWSPTVGLGGHYITVRNGNLSSQTTFGAGRNDAHVSVLGTLNYPQALWSWVAALGGVIGFSKNLGRSLGEAIEIARPLQTLPLSGLRAPKAISDRWAPADRDSLYRNGIGAVVFRADGQPAIDRIVTTYQTNVWGQPDITFLDIETLAISAYVGKYMKLILATTYPRHVLRDDNPRSLQGVATPKQIKATIVHAYTDLSEVAGIVEKVDLFSKYLIVERSGGDPNRVNAYLPIDVANQLRVMALNITIFTELNSQIASGL